MSARAYVPAEAPSPAAQFREHSDYLRWELAPEERVGAPLVRRRKRWWLRGVVVLSLAGGAWAFAQDPTGTWELASHRFASAIATGEALLGDWRTPPRPAGASAPPLALAPLQLIEAERLAAAGNAASAQTDGPVIGGVAPAEPVAKARVDEPAEAVDVERPEPLPPLPPLTDPLQKRAEAVGLHPELSRALLQSLTPSDFKTAGIGIKKAIAETPDDGVLVWPPKPQSGMARFRIHFVPGISAVCRRYVVGVGKNGWLTTALPMERCGVKPRPLPGSAAAKSASRP